MAGVLSDYLKTLEWALAREGLILVHIHTKEELKQWLKMKRL